MNAWLIVWSSLLQPPMLLVGDTWVARWSKAVIVTMVWILLNILTYPNKFSYPNRRRNWLVQYCSGKWGCTVFVSLSNSRFESFVSPSESSDARPSWIWNFWITEWNKVLKLLYHRVKQLFVSQSDETFRIMEWRKVWNILYIVSWKREYIYLTDNIWPLPPHNLTLLTLSAKSLSDVFT